MSIDKSSYSNPNDIRVTHLDLSLSISFDKQTLSGHADLTLVSSHPTSDLLILDSSHLLIFQIKDLNTNSDLFFSFADEDPVFGRKLSVKLAKPLGISGTTTIRISYSTTPQATAIQWLSPEQTQGKVHPYLFSQCEEIHCRSLVPIQDTPGVKFTYSATISVVAPLRVLMSAILKKEETVGGHKVFNYEQKIPIPAYLLALAAGDIVYRDLSDRCRVYCEEALINACEFEMEPTEKYLKASEAFLTPYEWGRYDLVVLPGSFPFGGMENPCLTFVSPTLLSGDRTLTDVVVHEITHSWIGNLVTNKNWEHFWLNEGINVYTERSISRVLHGDKHFQIAALEGLKSLEGYIKGRGEHHPFTALVTRLEGVDPDDAYSILYYEKGFCLLYLLENLFGRDFIQNFLISYIKKFRLQVVETKDFTDHLLERLKEKYPEDYQTQYKKVEWDKWFYNTGAIPQTPVYDLSVTDDSNKLAEKVAEEGKKSEGWVKHDELNTWHTLEILLFFEKLISITESEKLKFSEKFFEHLEEHYNFSKRNAEIRTKWFILALKHKYGKVDGHIAEFLSQYGRMKFLKPVYAELKNQGRTDFALEIFNKASSFYHSIAAKVLKNLISA